MRTIFSGLISKFGIFIVLSVAIAGTTLLPNIAYGEAYSAVHSFLLRDIASNRYPIIRRSDDTDTILETYPAYLRYVVRIGKRINKKRATALQRRYNKLRRVDPERAARFLKGLRYELEQRAEFLNLNRKRLTTKTKAMKRLVRRYLKTWYHEADELLFAAIASKRIGRSEE